MISFISLFEIINVVALDSNISLLIAVSLANAAAINPNDIKTLLVNGSNTFFIKDNPVFSNAPKVLPKNPPECLFYAIDNIILADKPFAKSLRSFETCVH